MDTNEEKISELAKKASKCTICDLSRTRTNVVFGEGNPNALMVIIGEGPGQEEDRTGRPFVGRSGQLLDACLAENGITRKHVFICNIVRCRACNIEGSKIINRPPTPQEATSCSTWLLQTLEVIKPLVILCLGAPSASNIIHPDFRITKERGQWFPTRYANYATASFHPSYILRQGGASDSPTYRTLVEDIGAARLKVIEAKREIKSSDLELALSTTISE